ncbi:MAG: tetratricopeptide repeat protein [Verrucomicrobium sp.]|nr:tetratricopeptide repeat protein [Verrucomicrobium sp.]
MKTERDLSGGASDLWTRARAASDPEYAIPLLQSLVKLEPSFLDGRRALRDMEITRHRGASSLAKQLQAVKAAAAGLKAAGTLKKNPAEALSLAEDALVHDPFHTKANETLAAAALALELPQIAVLAYETLADATPQATANLHRLADLHMKQGNFQLAIDAYERALRVDPRDGEAQAGLKNASARLASSSGGWERQGDFRESLRDKEQAAALEQESKVAKSADAIAEQIARLDQLRAAEPNNLNHPRQIADLLLQREDYESAIAWYEYTYNQGGQTDAALEKKISGLRLKKVDHDMAAARAALAAEPGRADLAKYVEDLEVYRRQLHLQTAQAMVQRYPNDKQFHYELGKAYVELGMYKEARPALQEGKRQPSVRAQASNLLGICFWKSNMFDLAEKELSAAAAEISTLNETKKEILYNLGSVQEAGGKKEAAIETFKQIYEVDLTYRDVAARVESSYNPAG